MKRLSDGIYDGCRPSKRTKLCENAEEPENVIAATLPKEIIGKITHYLSPNSLELHTPCRLNKHWKRCMESIYAKDLSQIHHIQASISYGIDSHIQASTSLIFDLGNIFGIPLIASSSTSRLYQCTHKKHPFPKDEFESDDKLILINALRGACRRGETFSVMVLLKEILPTKDKASLVHLMQMCMRESLLASSVSTLDAIINGIVDYANKRNVQSLNCDLFNLAESCPLDADESIVIRLTKMAVHQSLIKCVSNTLDDLTTERIPAVDGFVPDNLRQYMIILWSRHIRLLQTPLIAGLVEDRWNLSLDRRLEVLHGNQQCFDWFTTHCDTPWWQAVYDSWMSSSYVQDGVALERILQHINTRLMPSYVPIFDMSFEHLFKILMNRHASVKCFELACDFALTHNNTNVENEIKEQLRLDHLIPVVIKQFADSEIPYAVPHDKVDTVSHLIEKLKICINLFPNPQQQCIVECPGTTKPWIHNFPNGIALGKLLHMCIDQLNVHFIPNTDSHNLLYLVAFTSHKSMKKLWLQWMQPAKHSSSFCSTLVKLLRQIIMLQQVDFLEWVMNQHCSFVFLDPLTGLMQEDLWQDCLISFNMAMCCVFDSLPKPTNLVHARVQQWEHISITATCHDIAMMTHDLDWIKYVSQFSPSRQTSLVDLIRYLARDNPVPAPWTNKIPLMQLNTLLTLTKELSEQHPTSPPIPREMVMRMLQKLKFDSDDSFYRFCEALCAILRSCRVLI
jgi:hypothetical protein